MMDISVESGLAGLDDTVLLSMAEAKAELSGLSELDLDLNNFGSIPDKVDDGERARE